MAFERPAVVAFERPVEVACGLLNIGRPVECWMAFKRPDVSWFGGKNNKVPGWFIATLYEWYADKYI